MKKHLACSRRQYDTPSRGLMWSLSMLSHPSIWVVIALSPCRHGHQPKVHDGRRRVGSLQIGVLQVECVTLHMVATKCIYMHDWIDFDVCYDMSQSLEMSWFFNRNCLYWQPTSTSLNNVTFCNSKCGFPWRSIQPLFWCHPLKCWRFSCDERYYLLITIVWSPTIFCTLFRRVNLHPFADRVDHYTYAWCL